MFKDYQTIILKHFKVRSYKKNLKTKNIISNLMY